ncbi:MAG TPA: hypothetical protein VE242_09010, partial [Chthoniobacterales bacterium]|nr:hypothetical protein [Chthoniobacterales bacterium]
DVTNSLVYHIPLKKAGVPAEMHLYAQGGHAFGLWRTKFPITRWPEFTRKLENPKTLSQDAMWQHHLFPWVALSYQ